MLQSETNTFDIIWIINLSPKQEFNTLSSGDSYMNHAVDSLLVLIKRRPAITWNNVSLWVGRAEINFFSICCLQILGRFVEASLC